MAIGDVSPPPPEVDPDSIGVKSVCRTQVYSGRRHGVTGMLSLELSLNFVQNIILMFTLTKMYLK